MAYVGSERSRFNDELLPCSPAKSLHELALPNGVLGRNSASQQSKTSKKTTHTWYIRKYRNTKNVATFSRSATTTHPREDVRFPLAPKKYLNYEDTNKTETTSHIDVGSTRT
jgi:hypothetical protein